MIFSLMTYNTCFNQAVDKLTQLLEKQHPDILCLQEIETTEQNLKTICAYGYTLADYSNSFIKFGKIYGLATFYKNDTFKMSKSNVIFLRRSIFEFITSISRFFRGKNQSRTVLKTKLFNSINKKIIIFYNIHLSVHGTNSIRLKQITQVLKTTTPYNTQPLIVTGDFNYPYGRKKLEEITKSYNLKEATNNIPFTFTTMKNSSYNWFFLLCDKFANFIGMKNYKLDYIFYKNIKCLGSEKIDVGFSDHFPIISRFQL